MSWDVAASGCHLVRFRDTAHIGLPLLLLLSGAWMGCPEAEETGIDCARIAVPLFVRCDQRFSKADPWRCLSTYVGTEAERFARADALTVKLCEAGAAEGETECYETSSCQEISMGACALEDSLRNRIDDTCRMGCEQAVVTCQVPCTALGSADACDDCAIECEAERVRCFERCPLR